MSDTPETDAKASQDIGFFSCATVPADFARKLERERDEADFVKRTSEADYIKQIAQLRLCIDVALEKLRLAEKIRDQTRKEFVDFLDKINARERDEAHEKATAAWTENLRLDAENRRLERERDETRDDLEFLRELYRVQENYLELARRERDEAREQNAKLREIAKRAIKLLTTRPALFVFPTLEIHNEEHGKQLRAELDKLKEGMR